MGVKKRVKARDAFGVDLESLFYDFQKENEAKGLARATIVSYDDSFKRFFKYLGEPPVVDGIDFSTIQNYIRFLLDDGGGIKPSSVNHYLRDIRAFLYFCMGKGEIPHFKIKQMKVQEEAPDPYSVDELKLLTKEPLKEDTFVTWRTWAVIYWILDTGNRAETVCNIKMGDISDRQVRLAHTKNKKAQAIELGVALLPILNKYIRKFRSDATVDDYLFPLINNEKMTVNALKQSIRDYNIRRGVKKTGVHDFRRTYTTMSLASGNTTEQEVADRLGHGNTSLLKRYAVFSTKQKRKFHDASSPLNELVTGGITRKIINKEKR